MHPSALYQRMARRCRLIPVVEMPVALGSRESATLHSCASVTAGCTSIPPEVARVAVKPSPEPDSVSLPYWQAARAGQLVVQRCGHCGCSQFPPDLLCRRCQSDNVDFEAVSGAGHVFSFGIYTRTFDPAFPAPYVLALVELADRPGVRLMTNIVATPAELVRVGLSVEVCFEDRGEWALPQFRAVESAGGDPR